MSRPYLIEKSTPTLLIAYGKLGHAPLRFMISLSKGHRAFSIFSKLHRSQQMLFCEPRSSSSFPRRIEPMAPIRTCSTCYRLLLPALLWYSSSGSKAVVSVFCSSLPVPPTVAPPSFCFIVIWINALMTWRADDTFWLISYINVPGIGIDCHLGRLTLTMRKGKWWV